MSKSLNKAIIVGRLGMDPELHQGSKTEVASFSLADSSFLNGEERVQWHRVCAFGKQALLVHQHLHKGDLCCIEGRIDSSVYEKDGVKKSSMSVIAEKITFLSSMRKNNSSLSPESDSETTAV